MKKIKIKNKGNLIIIILFVAAFLFMSVGFAAYNQTLNFGGTAILIPDGNIYLKSIRLVSSTRATATPRINEAGFAEFNLRFQAVRDVELDYSATFEIVVANESSYDYVYTLPPYEPTVSKNGQTYPGYVDYVIPNINTGDIIPAKSEKAFTSDPCSIVVMLMFCLI